MNLNLPPLTFIF